MYVHACVCVCVTLHRHGRVSVYMFDATSSSGAKPAAAALFVKRSGPRGIRMGILFGLEFPEMDGYGKSMGNLWEIW